MISTRLRLAALGLLASLPLFAAAPSAAPRRPVPHPQPTTHPATEYVRHGAVVFEAETGAGGWERLESQGETAIRATRGATMVYRVRFDEPGIYFVHLRCHHLAGMRNEEGKVLRGDSTNDAVVTFGGAPLYAADETTRPVGMRCHSKDFRWWSLPKGPGAHTPEPIKNRPVHLWAPAAGVYELALAYRSPGLTIDKIAITSTPEPPAAAAP